MSRPDDLVSAAIFATRDAAEAAWGLLAEAGIPASVITEPGTVGRRDHLVMVHREDLEEAQACLAEQA